MGKNGSLDHLRPQKYLYKAFAWLKSYTRFKRCDFSQGLRTTTAPAPNNTTKHNQGDFLHD
jgi:hypothetical protein